MPGLASHFAIIQNFRTFVTPDNFPFSDTSYKFVKVSYANVLLVRRYRYLHVYAIKIQAYS